MQRVAFKSAQGKSGYVEVAYLEERPLEVEGPFFAEERNLINILADMLRSHLDRGHSKHHIQRQLDHITALHDIDFAIVSSLEVRVTLNIVLEQITQHLGADAADILLLDATMSSLKCAAGRGFRTPEFYQEHLILGQGLPGRAALERRLIFVPNLREVTSDRNRASRIEKEGFITYHGIPLIAKGRVKGVLEIFHRCEFTPDDEWRSFLDALAGQTAIAVDNLEMFDEIQRSNLELEVAYDVTLEGWTKALDLRDKETEGHSARVTEMTVRLARAMKFDDRELTYVRRGALLHDIGKLGIPDSILLKPGPLTDDEWVVMRKHPVYAYEWLSPIAYLRPALDIPHYHHEKWNGTGYPVGLQEHAIPLAARIFAIVDVYDALTSDRPYRKGWTKEKTLEHIRSQSGSHFDPEVVQAFMKLVSEGIGPSSP